MPSKPSSRVSCCSFYSTAQSGASPLRTPSYWLTTGETPFQHHHTWCRFCLQSDFQMHLQVSPSLNLLQSLSLMNSESLLACGKIWAALSMQRQTHLHDNALYTFLGQARISRCLMFRGNIWPVPGCGSCMSKICPVLCKHMRSVRQSCWRKM